MVLISHMIRTGRLTEFVRELVNIRNEELDERTSWEYWLHKDFERSFNEFQEALESSKKAANVTEEQLADIVRQSRNIASMSVMPQTDEGKAD